MAGGKFIAIAPVQGGGMGVAVTNVREFPKAEEIPALDRFLIKYGAKEMVSSTKKETEGQTAIKWNQSVLGLIGTLLAVLGVFATVLISYVTLSVNFSNYQKVTDDKIQRLEQKIDKIEDWQRQDSLQKAKVQGYQLGAAETKQKEEK